MHGLPKPSDKEKQDYAWKQINKIIHKGKNKGNINCTKTSHGTEYNPHTIGNKINKYFRTIV